MNKLIFYTSCNDILLRLCYHYVENSPKKIYVLYHIVVASLICTLSLLFYYSHISSFGMVLV